MPNQTTPRPAQPSRAAKRRKETVALADDLLISGDRLRTHAHWDLRDEQTEAAAYEKAIGPMVDRDDFDPMQVEARADELRTQFGPRRDEHALTAEQIARIAAAFSFDTTVIDNLSKHLAVALNPIASPFVVRVPRQVAANRGQLKLREGRKPLKRAYQELERGLDLLEPLDSAQATDREGAELFEELRKEHEDLLHRIEALHRRYGILAERPDAVLDLSPVHKSEVADERRKIIVFCAFEVWGAAGRKLSTTGADRRKGPLCDFCSAIVACVTDPAIALSVDTLFDDLKAYKASIKIQ